MSRSRMATAVEPVKLISSTPQEGARIPQLDGLRGIAIVAVILYHYLGPLTQVPLAPIHWLGRAFGLGWCGVDLFFVISGYLIGGILLEHRTSPAYFKTFYARRFFRIVPPYAIIASFSAWYLSRAGMHELPWYAYATLTQNFFLALGLGNTLLSHFWSLGVEEQFYLTLPPLIRFKPSIVPNVAMCSFVICPLIRALEFAWHGATAAQFLPFGRMDSLLAGVLVAHLLRRPASRDLRRNCAIIACAAASAIAALWAGDALHGAILATFGYSLCMALFASTLLMVVRFRLASRPLSLSWLTHIGMLSYGIYMLHAPVWRIIQLTTRLEYLEQTGLAAIFTYALALLSWHILEKRATRAGHQFKW